MASNHAIYMVFCGCPAKNIIKTDCFFKRLGFKHGRKIAQNMEKFCRKGIFRLLEASKGHKTTVFTRVCAPSRHKTLKIAMVLGYVRFKVATKHRTFSSSCLQEWPQTTLFAGFLVAERVFSALGGFKVTQKRRYLHGLARLPGTKPCKLGWF